MRKAPAAPQFKPAPRARPSFLAAPSAPMRPQRPRESNAEKHRPAQASHYNRCKGTNNFPPHQFSPTPFIEISHFTPLFLRFRTIPIPNFKLFQHFCQLHFTILSNNHRRPLPSTPSPKRVGEPHARIFVAFARIYYIRSAAQISKARAADIQKSAAQSKTYEP